MDTCHPSVSMQAQAEMSNESQCHAHADRQGKWGRGPGKRDKGDEEQRRTRKEGRMYKKVMKVRVTSPILAGAE